MDWIKFFDSYKENRSLVKTYRKFCLSRIEFTKMLKTNRKIYDLFHEVRQYIKSTFKCKICKLVFENKYCYVSEKVCIDCFNRKYFSVQNKLKKHLEILLTQTKANSPYTELTIEDLLKLYTGKCYYTDKDMFIDGGFYGISIDRLDSNKGYTKDNVVLCCWGINKMKSDIPYNDFINICKMIVDKHGKIT